MIAEAMKAKKRPIEDPSSERPPKSRPGLTPEGKAKARSAPTAAKGKAKPKAKSNPKSG